MKVASLNRENIKKINLSSNDPLLLEKEEIESLLKLGFKISGIDPDGITFTNNPMTKTDLDAQDVKSLYSIKKSKVKKDLEKKHLLKLEKSILKGNTLEEREFTALKYYLRNDPDKLSYYFFLMCDSSESIIDKMMEPPQYPQPDDPDTNDERHKVLTIFK
ncbi:hypothetical protein OAN21_02570 [Alphaproteobacteria bacterium]|nr:hypothetical protein [Alphaproteobacteria bacterium]